MKSRKLVLWFNEIGIKDVSVVGGKNASLGEMYRNLTKKGVRIPNGFAVTAQAYQYLLEKAGIEEDIKKVLKGLNTRNVKNLQSRGRKIRELIRGCTFPPELRKAIVDGYKKLCKQYGSNADVAVRSSATAEDLPTASFAGQQESYLNIRGEKALLNACRNCFASLFTDRAISYREDKGFDHFKVYLSIGVQKMVRSDLACSGVMFTLDTETGFKDVVFITGAYGLGENIVQGAVNPDEFYVFKPTLKKGFKPIITKTLGKKQIRMVYSKDPGRPTKNLNVPLGERKQFVLTEKEILMLAKWACIVEDHYSKQAKHHKPMDLEWAKDGKTGKLFIVQARPETVQSQKNTAVLEEYKLLQKGKILAIGDEGGFAPEVNNITTPLTLIQSAINKAGYNRKISINIDVAASGFFKNKKYKVDNKLHSTKQLLSLYKKLIKKFPITSIEDPFHEEDFTAFAELNKMPIQVVGDDLTVTNLNRIQKAIKNNSCSALLVKPNQIGTVTETLKALSLAKRAGWKTMVSHRSGETTDTFIADLAVGTAAGQFKAGAPCRGERVAKYNRLLRIEEERVKYTRNVLK